MAASRVPYHGLRLSGGLGAVTLVLALLLPLAMVQGQPLMPAPTPDDGRHRQVIVDTQNVTAHLHVKETKTEVGEPATVHVELDKSESYDSLKIELPENQQSAVHVDHVRHDPKLGWLFDVRFLKPGDGQAFGPLEIKGVKADGEESFQSDTLSFNVPSPRDKQGDPREYTGPMEIHVNPLVRVIQWILGHKLLVGAALLAFAVIAWLVKRWLGRRTLAEVLSPPPPPIPPIIEAFQSLDQLESLSVFVSNGARLHYFALSELLRRYVERQYAVTALEMTEEEVSAFVRRELLFNPGAPALQGVFRNASMAKFAKWLPEEGLVRADLVSARTFLLAEKQRIDAPPPPPASLPAPVSAPTAGQEAGR